MKLRQLILKESEVQVRGNASVEITGLTSDSRKVSPGNLFFAKKGATVDGATFIPKALEAGAAAIVTDLYDPFCKAAQIITPHVQALEAPLAARYYGHPSKELVTVGITGSKGNTTTTYLVQYLLEQLGVPCGLISTVETAIRERRFPSTHTTHDAIANHKLLREMCDSGCKGAAVEVSSHGLTQGRVDLIEFTVGIFTNLYPDHLDYHKTVEQYALAKRRLMERTRERALLNADNEWTPFMLEKVQCPHWTYGIDRKADIRATDIAFSPTGTYFTVTFQESSHPFRSHLMGRFNVYNLLTATAVGLHRGATLPEIATALERSRAVPGRLEEVVVNKPFRIFVDYAHTGESLENVLKTLRELTTRKIWVVFGCGGNRDPARRTQMALAAQKFADRVIVTADNPRSEDPQEIARQITAALSCPHEVELDRKQAIRRAVTQAEEGDIVLITGKGHEKVQIFAHQTVPFDDVAIAQAFCLT